MMGLIFIGIFAVLVVAELIYLLALSGSSNQKGRQVDVRVLSCEQKMPMNRNNTRIYEVKVDFYGSNGEILVRTLQSAISYMPGDMIRCRYMEKTGLLMPEMTPEEQAKTRKSILIFLIIFLFFIGIVAIIWGSNTGKELPKETVRLWGYFISILFMAVSVFGIYKNNRTKQKMHDMISLPGIQVDYTIHKGRNSDHYADIFNPIYEYEWGGEKKRLYSSIGSSGEKYRTIGRRVHILVDPQTGKAICQEDEKTAGYLYLLFGIVGLGVFVLMLALSFGILS